MERERFGFSTPFNIVAAFPDERSARAATAKLRAGGIPRAAIREAQGNGADPAEAAELQAEMRDEMTESFGGPAFYLTGDQAKGAVAGTFALSVGGLVVGLALGLAWAYLVDADLSRLARVMIAAGLGAITGGTVGFIAGGGMKPRFDEAAAADGTRPLDDRPSVAERDVLIAVQSTDQAVAERAAELLAGSGAERVDAFDAGGMPLPAQHDHPRPADPEGWWWANAGKA